MENMASRSDHSVGCGRAITFRSGHWIGRILRRGCWCFGGAPENPPAAAGVAENQVAGAENHDQATTDHHAVPDAKVADNGHTAPPTATAAETPPTDVAAKNNAVQENNVAPQIPTRPMQRRQIQRRQMQR